MIVPVPTGVDKDGLTSFRLELCKPKDALLILIENSIDERVAQVANSVKNENRPTVIQEYLLTDLCQHLDISLFMLPLVFFVPLKGVLPRGGRWRQFSFDEAINFYNLFVLIGTFILNSWW